MILTGTKIKVTLSILTANHPVFQISDLRLTFPFKTKQRFLHKGITSLKEKVTTIRFDFTKCPNFSCKSRMEVSLKIDVIEQSLIMNCHTKVFTIENLTRMALINCFFNVFCILGATFW